MAFYNNLFKGWLRDKCTHTKGFCNRLFSILPGFYT
ncbi:hypothetical protein COPEUT_01967 [Coprococcus eutactus ATCC 27759]|nr:hypothetical protein COPEUT_01967 [Coprococcus eutactus ATCC 27759]